VTLTALSNGRLRYTLTPHPCWRPATSHFDRQAELQRPMDVCDDYGLSTDASQALTCASLKCSIFGNNTTGRQTCCLVDWITRVIQGWMNRLRGGGYMLYQSHTPTYTRALCDSLLVRLISSPASGTMQFTPPKVPWICDVSKNYTGRHIHSYLSPNTSHSGQPIWERACVDA
jgi:hypothetical protein